MAFGQKEEDEVLARIERMKADRKAMTKTPEPQNMPDEIFVSPNAARKQKSFTAWVGPNSYMTEKESYTRTATTQPYTARERVLAEAVRRLERIARALGNDGKMAQEIEDAITLATEITSSPVVNAEMPVTVHNGISDAQTAHNTPAPTLESLLANVPDGWDWQIRSPISYRFSAHINNHDYSVDFVCYGPTPTLALSAALAKLGGAE